MLQVFILFLQFHSQKILSNNSFSQTDLFVLFNPQSSKYRANISKNFTKEN